MRQVKIQIQLAMAVFWAISGPGCGQSNSEPSTPEMTAYKAPLAQSPRQNTSSDIDNLDTDNLDTDTLQNATRKSLHTQPPPDLKPPSRPARCTVKINIGDDESIAVNGYGASDGDARESTLLAAYAVREQLLLPQLLMPLAMEQDFAAAQNEVVQRLLPENAAEKSSVPHTAGDSFFTRLPQNAELQCTPMTFPSDSIPQWRATWKAGENAVTVKGKTPTAIVEEAREAACYNQLAGAMQLEINTLKGLARGKKTHRALSLFKSRWHDIALNFARCYAQKPFLTPHDGTIPRSFKDPVQCTADLSEISDLWTPLRGSATGTQVAVMATSVDGARQRVRQEIRHAVFDETVARVFQILPLDGSVASRFDTVKKWLSDYLAALTKASAIRPQCRYVGGATDIEWSPSDAAASLHHCSGLHPWWVEHRPLKVAVTNSLEMAKEQLCTPLIKNGLPLVLNGRASMKPADTATSIAHDFRLGQVLQCFSSCRLNTDITYSATPARPQEVPDELLFP